MPGKSRIGVGLLGCARIAQRSILPALAQVPALELRAISSRSRDKAEAVAGPYGVDALEGYARLLERPDVEAVYVPLPNGLHEEWVVKALKAGKHVLCEKSLGTSLASVRRMVEASRAAGRVLMENFMFLHHGQHAFVRELLRDGAVGAVRLFRSSFGFPPLPAEDIRYDPSLGGGALLDAGCYTVRAALDLLGPDLSVATARLTLDPQRGVDVAGEATLRTGGPAPVSAQLAFGFDHFYQCSYELWGTAGLLRAERAFTAPPGYSPRIVLERPGESRAYVRPAENQAATTLAAFAAVVAEEDAARYHEDLLRQASLLDRVRAASPPEP